MAFSTSWSGTTPAAGKGIRFNWFLQLMANFVALVADPTLFTWYAAGTWTPVIGGASATSGQTYSVQVGWSIKIGKLVIAGFRAVLSAKGTITGAVQIQGLPFTSENTTNQVAIADLRYDTLATSWASLHARIVANSAVAAVEGNSAAALSNDAPLAATDIANTTGIEGTLVYRTT